MTFPSPTMPSLIDPAAIIELYPLLAFLRREAPVAWVDPLSAWIVTRYDDVAAAFRNPALSSQRMDLIVRYQLRGKDPSLAKEFERIGNQQMLFRDGAEHHRLRVLGNRGFTPSMLDRARPIIQRTVDRLLDRLQDAKSIDLVADFAQPLPALVIAELFAIPEEDRTKFQSWSDAIAQFFGMSFGDPEAAAQASDAAAVKLEAYFLDLLERRRQTPGEDLISLLLAGQAEGKLSAEEVCAQCILFIAAGHVTTIDQIANGVNSFLDSPDQWQRLQRDPSLMHAAVEEVLRHDSAVPFVHRIARAETQVRGQTIKPGDVVYLSTAAANRDPEVFSDPDRFDIGRTDNRHLSFGTGAHVCLGAGLARRELEISLATLCRRFPSLARDAAPAMRRCESLIFRGFHCLPVRLDGGLESREAGSAHRST